MTTKILMAHQNLNSSNKVDVCDIGENSLLSKYIRTYRL